MKRIAVWGATIAVLGLLGWFFHETWEEKAKEREREQPVSTATRLTSDSSGVTLALDAEMQERIGISDEKVRSESAPEEVLAYGQVLDPGPLVAEEGELSAAEAAAQASRAEAERQRALFKDEQNVSRKSLDAAEAQERADRARAETANARALSSWGEVLGALPAKARREFVAAISTHRIALVRVGLPAGEALETSPSGASVSLLGHEDEFFSAEHVFSARAVDPQTQGIAFILSLAGRGGALPAGAAVTARLTMPGRKMRAVIVPRSAVVRHAGATWVFVRMDQERFSQRLVTLSRRTGDGWVVVSGIRAGERVVTRGAQLLLSEELKSQIKVGDESEADRDKKERR